jgi:hypothetical protein
MIKYWDKNKLMRSSSLSSMVEEAVHRRHIPISNWIPWMNLKIVFWDRRGTFVSWETIIVLPISVFIYRYLDSFCAHKKLVAALTNSYRLSMWSTNLFQILLKIQDLLHIASQFWGPSGDFSLGKWSLLILRIIWNI